METTTHTRSSPPDQAGHDDRYPDLLVLMQRHLDALTPTRLYEVAVEGSLYDVFLQALPAHRRAHYQCRACRNFVERYGGLVEIREDGSLRPGSILAEAVDAVSRAVARAPVAAVFYADRNVVRLGLPFGPGVDPSIGGPWRHMSVDLPAVTRRGVTPPLATQSASQASAARHEERGMLQRALADYPHDLVLRAHTLLVAGALSQAEKHAPAAEWLLTVIDQQAATRHDRRRDALLWRAVAEAPAGWAHLRGGVLGALLGDLKAGMSDEAVRRRHAERVDPLTYQRAQAAPTAGNVAAAERLVERLGIADSLRRRFALLEDVLPRAIWPGSAQYAELKDTGRGEPRGGAVFGHLLATRRGDPGPDPRIAVDGGRITVARLVRSVLPTAARLHLLVPSGPAPFCATVTAAVPASPPILQWDREDDRLPLSWYLHHPLTDARSWSLVPGALAPVTAVAYGAHLMREREFPASDRCGQHGPQLHLLLDGCRDSRTRGPKFGGGLFPSLLRAELHEVRATIEHHAKVAEVEGVEQATACGYLLSGSTFQYPATIVATTRDGQSTRYVVDRWD